MEGQSNKEQGIKNENKFRAAREMQKYFADGAPYFLLDINKCEEYNKLIDWLVSRAAKCELYEERECQ